MDRTDEGFERDEFHRGIGVPEMIDPVKVIIIFDTHTEPDVIGPWQMPAHIHHTFRAFGEYLEAVMLSSAHYIEYFLNEVEGHAFVEQVAHGAYEYHLWLRPFKRRLDDMLVGGQCKSVRIIRLSHGFEAPGHTFGITVLAPGTDLGASGDWVPGRIGPFDFS